MSDSKKTLVLASAALNIALSKEHPVDIVLLEEKEESEKKDPSLMEIRHFEEDTMEDFPLLLSDEKPPKNTFFNQKHPKSKFKNPRPR